MTPFAMRFAIALLVLLGGDAAWLSYFARAMFRPTLGSILLETPRWWAAGIFYPCYALGIVVFAVAPAMRQHSLATALLNGAMLGALAYGTYDLTNLATIRAWSVPLALIDIGWGTLLTAFAAAASYALTANR